MLDLTPDLEVELMMLFLVIAIVVGYTQVRRVK